MIERFFNLLGQATARIPRHYFELPVAGRQGTIFRERVYSYELYHQLRTILDADRELTHYVLGGEIDKQGHPLIRACAPDFVVHMPGRMDRNLVAIEVKPISTDQLGIEKDRTTLEYFLSEEVGYQCGVQLVYGGNEGDLKRFIDIYRDACECIELFWHPAPQTPAIPVRFHP